MGDNNQTIKQIALLIEYVQSNLRHLRSRMQNENNLISTLQAKTYQRMERTAMIDYNGMLGNGTSVLDDFSIYVSNNKNAINEAEIRTRMTMITTLNVQMQREKELLEQLQRITGMTDEEQQFKEINLLTQQLPQPWPKNKNDQTSLI